VKHYNFLLVLCVVVGVLSACRSGPPTGPLAAPSSLSAVAGNGQIELSWQDNSTAEEGFRIYRRLEAETEFIRLDFVTPVDAETFLDTAVSSADTYVYQVRAFAGEEEGPPSRESEPVKPALGENQVTLTVRRAGSGEGVTTSSPPGINCRNSTGGSCSLDVEIGTTITLNANSDEVRPSVFAGFSGACTSTTSTCSVVMDTSKEVTATYAEARPGLTVQLTGDGAGRVYDSTADVPGSGGPYINCTGAGSDCTEESYWQTGNAITLYAEPATGTIFAGWEGCATVAAGKGLPNGRCDFQVAASTVISARFLADRPEPVINEFNASPAQVAPLGTPVVLSWDITYSGTDFTLELTDNQGTTYNTAGKGLTDSLAVGTLNAARTFTLRVTTEFFGEDTAQDSITVGDGPRVTFTVGDTTITSTASTTLDWEVENADAVTLTTGAGVPEPVPPTLSSPRLVTPGVTTEYILTATKAGFEPVTERRTITVGSAPVFTTPLSASDTTVTQGQEINLAWVVTGADTLLLEKVSGGNRTTQPVSVSPEPESPEATTTYRILATNAFDTTPSNPVEVRVGTAPSITFTSEPAANSEGVVSEVVDRPVTLRWSVTGADTITLNGDEVGAIDSRDATPRQVGSTPYVLIARNEFGEATQTITVEGRAAPPPPPEIASFTADDTDITAADSTILRWTVTNAATVTLSGGEFVNEPVNLVDQRTVSPDVTTTYTLTASRPGSPSDTEPTVQIEVGPPPVITFINSPNPNPITLGDFTDLSWSITNSPIDATITLSGGELGTTGVSGVTSPRRVTPDTTGTVTYTLNASNRFGAATPAPIDVTVNPVAPPPVEAPNISFFNASPTEITEGSSTTLEWDVVGTGLTVEIDNAVGVVAPQGSQPVSPGSSTTYTLTATNEGGRRTANARVVVSDPPPPPDPPVINSFAASPGEIVTGESSTLTWDVSGEGLSVEIDNAIGAVPPQSSTSVSPPDDTTYTLTASNGGGTVTATAIVVVNDPPAPPVISSFTADPITIDLGNSSTLAWEVTGTPPLTISLFENGVLLAEGSEGTGNFSVNPTSEGVYTYTLTAGNEAGDDSATREVTVLLPSDDVNSNEG
jgi:hypothetical protein